MLKFDHLAIQIPHGFLSNTVNWYIDFFNCVQNWEQHSSFQPLTLERIPGICSIVELECEAFRFHIFEKKGTHESILVDHIQKHHLGFSVQDSNAITKISDKWNVLYASKRYNFVDSSYITPKMTDDLGIESIYFTDVNGLEFEVTHIPQASLKERNYD